MLRTPTRDEIILGDNLDVLPRFADGSFQLIYIDPPFNTGRGQRRTTLATVPDGRRPGRLPGPALRDPAARLVLLRRRVRRLPRVHRAAAGAGAPAAAPTGTLYFHIDYREAHYCKLLLDEVFGRECFLNEIIWAYDYGARRGGAGRPSTTRSSST